MLTFTLYAIKFGAIDIGNYDWFCAFSY